MIAAIGREKVEQHFLMLGDLINFEAGTLLPPI